MPGFDTAAASFDPCGHDHARCIASALDNAEQLCRRRGARLTGQRRQVLELIWQSHAPVGAYDLLEKMAAQEGRGRVAPPTVYRALEFLLAHGLIHRIESLNAYIGCARPDASHAGHFLICRNCHAAAELQDARIEEALHQGAADLGFLVESETVELRGLCPQCREHAEDRDAR